MWKTKEQENSAFDLRTCFTAFCFKCHDYHEGAWRTDYEAHLYNLDCQSMHCVAILSRVGSIKSDFCLLRRGLLKTK